VQSVHLQRRIAKPVAKLGDLSAVAIIQVLARAINLNAIETCVAYSLQARSGEALIYKEMSGKHMLHC
jgi:hypothetical protein